ncbi:MAG: hypothetical protein K0V04_33745 [Deltaproteobacteria bacterium]|nr:hypothetical protein [Deltaproteobacteria bacterium]
MPVSPPRADSSAVFNSGLDLELDLAAERPSIPEPTSKRGPAFLVAAIVASSLALAGAITVARTAAEPVPPVEAASADVVEPAVTAVPSSVPVPEPIPAVAANEPGPAAVQPRAHTRPRTTPPAPPTSAAAKAVPAAIATDARTPTSKPRVESDRTDSLPSSLPAPNFDTPTPPVEDREPGDAEPSLGAEAQPQGSAPVVELPGVETPSIFADEEPEPASPESESTELDAAQPPTPGSVVDPEPVPPSDPAVIDAPAEPAAPEPTAESSEARPAPAPADPVEEPGPPAGFGEPSA